jgi:hypothetical protein
MRLSAQCLSFHKLKFGHHPFVLMFKNVAGKHGPLDQLFGGKGNLSIHRFIRFDEKGVVSKGLELIACH